jgi:hypothetical protein
LVNVAASYIQLQRTIRAGQETIDAGGSVPTQVDFSNDMPRSTPFTSALGAELLILSPQEIDVLSTLEANMALTRGQLQDFSTGKRSFGLLTVRSLSQGIAHDMNILAQAFEKIAPSRKLNVESQPPELASMSVAAPCRSAKGTAAVKSEPGPPMTLGSAAAARVRLIVWCKECRHQVEPDPAVMAARYGAETPVSIGGSGCSLPLRQPAGRYAGERD